MKALFEKRVNYVKTPHNYGVAVTTIYFLWIPIWGYFQEVRLAYYR